MLCGLRKLRIVIGDLGKILNSLVPEIGLCQLKQTNQKFKIFEIHSISVYQRDAVELDLKKFENFRSTGLRNI